MFIIIPTRVCQRRLLVCVGVVALCGGFVGRGAQDELVAESSPHSLEPLDSIVGAPAPDQIVEVPPLSEAPEARKLLEEARVALEDGRFQRVLDLTDQAAHEPGGERGETFYLAALAKTRLGRFEEALQLAEKAARLQYGDADIHFLLGQLCRGQEKLELARQHYRTVTLAADRDLNNPKITRAWYALGQLLEEEGYDLAAAQAYEHFDRALWETHREQRNATEFIVLLSGRPYGMTPRRLELLRNVKRYEDSLRVAEWARMIWPDDPVVTRFLVQALLDTGDMNGAFARAKEWLDRGSPSEALLSLAIEAAAKAGALETWLEDLTARVLDGQQAEAARQLIRALKQTGDPERLIRIGRRLRDAWPGDDVLAWEVAAAQQAGGDSRAALETLASWVRSAEKLVALSPERLNQWRSWFAGATNVAESVRDLRGSLPRDFATDFVLGTTALAAGDTVLAEELLRGCLAEKPDFAPAYVVQGEMFLTNYQYEEARSYAEKLLAEHPDQPAALFLLARACEGLDDNERAEENLKLVLKQNPEEPLYNLALAQHYRRLGNLRGAQRYFQQALGYDAGNGEALEGLIDCYLRAGKLEIAKAVLDKLDRTQIPPDALRRIDTLMRHLNDPFGPAHLAELESQLEQYPEDIATARMLAGGLYYHEDFERTERVIEKVLTRYPDDYHLNMLLANVLAGKGEFEAAIVRLEIMLRRYPHRVAIMQPLALADLNDFRLEEGRALLQRLLTEDPDSVTKPAYRLQLLQSYLEFEECAPARDLIDGWLKEDPESEELQFQRLGVLLECGMDDDAYAYLKKRLDENPDEQRRSEFIQYGAETRHYDEVAAQIREWLKENPASAGLNQALITVLLRAERPDEALQVAKQFEGTYPESLLRRIWFGQCAAAKGDTDAALAEYEALLNERGVTGGLRQEIRFRIITTYQDAGRFDDGLAKCEEWLRDGSAEPELTPEILQYKRFLYQAAGRDEDSAGVLETLLQSNPGDVGLMNDLGYTWVDMGVNLDRGTEMIHKAVAAQPWNAAFLDSLGWAYYKTGDFSNARKYLERAVRLREGRDAVVYDHLGDAAFRLGDTDAARQAWEDSVRQIEAVKTEADHLRLASVLTEVRTKLAALQRADKPKTAPTVAEQKQESKP